MILNFAEIQAKRKQQEMFCPCYYCQIFTGKSYMQECDDKCDYASAIKVLSEAIANRDEIIKQYESYMEEIEREVCEVRAILKEG